MSYTRIVILSCLAMTAFAANSLLCRMALKDSGMDAVSFTVIRLISGAGLLWLLVLCRKGALKIQGDWLSALALFAYAAGFSFAYISLPTATGALLLFGAVQATMIGYGLYAGERFRRIQVFGIALAFIGLVSLLLPGLSAPSLSGSMLMIGAGIAWGIYSLRGKGVNDPTGVTAGNFIRTLPIAALMALFGLNALSLDSIGVWYAVASGAIASGLGYAVWYSVLPALKSTNAATVQLSVPVIAAIGGVLFLSEPISMRLALASVAVLGGIALVLVEKSKT